MPNRCNVVKCTGNYDDGVNKTRSFTLPRDETERQKWIDAIPPRKDFVIDPKKFHICDRHWPADAPMVVLPGGHTKPAVPPSVFLNVPPSVLPTPKPAYRPPPPVDRQLQYFKAKDKIKSYATFQPEKKLLKKHSNLMISRSAERLVCVFMAKDYSESRMSIIVHNKSTLCSPLTLHAFKDGIRVSFGKILNPNNGLHSYSQFDDVLDFLMNNDTKSDDIRSIDKAIEILQECQLAELSKQKKLNFITRQLQLLSHKKYLREDFCFGIECFPKSDYEGLRDVLVLPSKRKLQSIISGTNMNNVLRKTFDKIYKQQLNTLLLIDEVKIRPMVAYSGGVLNGMAKNDPESKATSMLCVMMKCLHGGPSLMISVTPVHKLTSSFQFQIVKEAAEMVENAGGIVIGSITDNHKINQQYCKLFNLKTDFQAFHLLDPGRDWFLLYDTVHILKCIRNNWLTEKCQKLSIDGKTVGSFSDVKDLYKSEQSSILKMTPLTQVSIQPSRLQLQNVQHVLKIFNEKVVAALRLNGAKDTAQFIQDILEWWNTVNVSAKDQDIKTRDPSRAVQNDLSTNLKGFVEKFSAAESAQGPNRFQCLTHDTRRALIQTTAGLQALSSHLLSNGFKYVLLREIQSDRIEGEFSVYRQSTGANAFMGAFNVVCAFKKRLTRFAASFLESIEEEPMEDLQNHSCRGPIDGEDGKCIEKSISSIRLTPSEESSAAFVAGWLERKAGDTVDFSDDEPRLTGDIKNFIEQVSRGKLIVPHVRTFELVAFGLRFMNHAKHRACCRKRLIDILAVINNYYDLGLSSTPVSESYSLI